jgi:G:T-mismatch repair DNA endonuclease (very short patch repair protein)
MANVQILSETRKHYARFQTHGRHIVLRIHPCPDDEDPFTYFKDSMEEILEISLLNVEASDMVGIQILNTVNSVDKPIGLSFRRKDQISLDVIMSLVGKVCQSNANFKSTDILSIKVDCVKVPQGHGGVKTKGRALSVLSHLKTSVVEVKSRDKCLAHAIVIAIAHVTQDPNYTSYRRGWKIKPKVDDLIAASGVNLSNGGGIPELEILQNYLADYRIVVYSGLRCENVIFDGHTNSSKRLNLLYDFDTKHFNVIVNIAGAMAKKYVCFGCSKGMSWKGRNTHNCEYVCTGCAGVPPCQFDGANCFCDECNRYFRSEKCFTNHKESKNIGKKTICERKRVCANCALPLNSDGHECYKTFCKNCNKYEMSGHFCYMHSLSPKIPSNKKVMFIFYDIECTQFTRIGDTNAFLHEPNLLCLEQFCSVCESDTYMSIPCPQCGERKHSFWGGDCIEQFMNYLTRDRPFCDKIIAIAHNARAYDLMFILDYAVKSGWLPDLILNGAKILCMKMEHVTFLDSLNFLPMSLRNLPKAFGLPSVSKGHYPHFFNTLENLDYVGRYPECRFYGVDYMTEIERQEFLEWYASVKDGSFDNRKELERYCQMDVSILKQACCEFRNTFLKIGNIDVFQESITIASVCNKVFRKNFLKPNSIGLIPKGGYRKADKQSRKALLWMRYLEMNYPIHIRHAGNGREYRLPELPNLKVDGFCEETKEVFSFNGCLWHGHECLPNRDVPIMGTTSETLESRYNQTMARLEKIVSAGYVCHVMWECEFDKILKETPLFRTVTATTRLYYAIAYTGGGEPKRQSFITRQMTKLESNITI